MSKELYKKHRPTKLANMVGQAAAVAQVKKMLGKEDYPHTWLLTGPSGCGKTTLARIIARMLKIDKDDVTEVNAANAKGIDMVRDIASAMGYKALKSNQRMYIIDEAHQLTAAAQDSFLKPLEDTPDHVVFVICTTNPEKLKKTIRTRCTEICLGSVQPKDMTALLDRVTEAEGIDLSKKVADRLLVAADGSPRKALVLLQQISGLEENLAMEVLQREDADHVAVDLCRALISRKPWKDVATILRGIDQDAESVRRAVLGYASAVLLNKPDGRAALILECFENNVFDSGKPGLVLAAYNVCGAK